MGYRGDIPSQKDDFAVCSQDIIKNRSSFSFPTNVSKKSLGDYLWFLQSFLPQENLGSG